MTLNIIFNTSLLKQDRRSFHAANESSNKCQTPQTCPNVLRDRVPLHYSSLCSPHWFSLNSSPAASLLAWISSSFGVGTPPHCVSCKPAPQPSLPQEFSLISRISYSPSWSPRVFPLTAWTRCTIYYTFVLICLKTVRACVSTPPMPLTFLQPAQDLWQTHTAGVWYISVAGGRTDRPNGFAHCVCFTNLLLTPNLLDSDEEPLLPWILHRPYNKIRFNSIARHKHSQMNSHFFHLPGLQLLTHDTSSHFRLQLQHIKPRKPETHPFNWAGIINILGGGTDM